MQQIEISSYREKHDKYFENKRNAKYFIVFNSPVRQKNVPFISPSSEASILIGNDSLTSREYRTKTVCKYLTTEQVESEITDIKIRITAKPS